MNRTLPPLAALQAFEAAARWGSFTLAARERHQRPRRLQRAQLHLQRLRARGGGVDDHAASGAATGAASSACAAAASAAGPPSASGTGRAAAARRKLRSVERRYSGS